MPGRPEAETLAFFGEIRYIVRMVTKVREFVRQQNMWEENDHIIAGISGGADSVCLFLMLLELKKEWNLKLTAVHVHHGLRGREADEDEAFVRELCEKYQVAFRSFRVDAADEARRRRISEEEAGRELRRELFEQVRCEEGADRIAVAHHRNDNVETFLFRLCRGSGIEGLCGMRPVNGRIVRPLLCVSRREIEAYLSERGQSYCTDRTNKENTYSRNKIRNQLIPYMEREVNAGCISHIADTMEQFLEIQEYMQEELAKIEKDCVIFEEDRVYIIEESYSRQPEILRKMLLKKCLIHISGKQRDIGSIHIRALENLMGLQCGREVHLPYEVLAEKDYKGIRLSKKREGRRKEEPYADTGGADAPEGKCSACAKGDMILQIPCAKGPVRTRVFARRTDANILEKTHTKWFDYDIIKNSLQIRTRKPGDYLVVDRKGSRQKLKSYFVNEKIPKEKRDNILLLAEGNHILWIIGYRMSMAYQVTEQTERILEVQVVEGYKDG